jgi:hypothetical protein
MMNGGDAATVAQLTAAQLRRRLTVAMDDGSVEQEHLSRRQYLMAFDGGWALEGGCHSTTAAADGDSGRGRLTAAMEDGDGGHGGQ